MKGIIISIVIALFIIGGAIFFVMNDEIDDTNKINNVTVINGKQIIEISAKGGYQPRKSVAKAGILTTIRFNTKGTFDCSASVRIPSLNVSKLLPNSGVTDIDIGTQQASILKGSCGMGMYPFEIEFQS